MTPRPFNPDTAPKVRLTDEDRSAIRADMNKVALKLYEAGIQLYGFYKIHDLVPYWNPLGFDFMCDNWRQLLTAASNAPRLGIDQINMPGSDNWLKAGVKSVGFTQTGRPPHVHLDIAMTGRGCVGSTFWKKPRIEFSTRCGAPRRSPQGTPMSSRRYTNGWKVLASTSTPTSARIWKQGGSHSTASISSPKTTTACWTR
jgi:hypothetical protein